MARVDHYYHGVKCRCQECIGRRGLWRPGGEYDPPRGRDPKYGKVWVTPKASPTTTEATPWWAFWR